MQSPSRTHWHPPAPNRGADVSASGGTSTRVLCTLAGVQFGLPSAAAYSRRRLKSHPPLLPQARSVAADQRLARPRHVSSRRATQDSAMNGSGHYIVDPSSTTHLDEVSCWCCGRAPPRLVSAPSACPTAVADSEARQERRRGECQRFMRRQRPPRLLFVRDLLCRELVHRHSWWVQRLGSV
mgnify:CR=1 FL=1